ncbi:ATP-dependent Clp protease proteolytic subunit [Adhaeribacter aquaticus]|uniref:ATP-dependent Clp protease proteolytic subunit n=1 Tax=Adhaeribacter aquaticus TaxID=299567 RepID=UPI000415D2FF|nr:ATP-dependent Clp protease proteolytic subunit [Adhaeribacter aquaticus]
MAKELHIRIDSHIGLLDDGWGWWPGFTVLELEWRLQEIPDPTKVILHISSPGGDVQEGLAIYNRLLELRETGITVAVIIESHCYSIATLIAMAASPGLLQARESSLWCVHKPMYPEIHFANADDLRAYANNLDAYEAAVNAAYVTRTGKSLADVQAQLRLDAIVSASDAVATGWIDSTLPALDGVSDASAKAVAALKPVAFVRPKKNELKQTDTNMANTKKPSAWEKFKTAFQTIIAEEENNDPEVVAASQELEGGEQIYFDGDLAEGTAVFTDVELTTPVADGDHKLADGRTITVAEGKVTAIAEAVDANAQALADKDQEIQNLQTELETAKAEAGKVAGLEAKVTNLTTEITNLRKKHVPGGGDNAHNPPQNFNGAGGAPANSKEAAFNNAAERFKKKYSK